MEILITGFGAIAVGLLLYGEHRDNARLRWLAKPAASLAFLAFAVINGGLDSAYGQLITAGLFLCLIGDVALLPRAEKTFLAGMGAFALGHLAYVAAFLTIWGGFSGLAAGAGVAVIIAIGYVLRHFWPHLGAFRIPVAAYCGIIAGMIVMSFATKAPSGGAPYWLAVGGAVAFAVSDISVARDQFVRRDFFNKLWGLPLYYAAQLTLAASVSL